MKSDLGQYVFLMFSRILRDLCSWFQTSCMYSRMLIGESSCLSLDRNGTRVSTHQMTEEEKWPQLFLKKNYLFCLYWVFVAACGLSRGEVSGSYSLLWCLGFSWCCLLLSRRTGSKACRLPQVCHHSTRNLPAPGVEPLSPALAGGFLTTEPSGKSQPQLLRWLGLGGLEKVPSDLIHRTKSLWGLLKFASICWVLFAWVRTRVWWEAEAQALGRHTLLCCRSGGAVGRAGS